VTLTLHVTTDVKEDRRVVIELPPDVPLGPAELTVTVGRPQPSRVVTLPTALPPTLKAFPIRPSNPDLAREFDAFQRLLPQLLRSHRGQYAAVFKGQLVGTGPDKGELAQEVYRRHGSVPIYIDLITDEPQPIPRIPSARVVVGQTIG
jgi:hypothetical protein